ncbi:PhaM family polyhydroxyalkanoate granule multifunctional regulatory protein [Lacisediminimonas profundi]|uniref:PhaM family polyhydroxyalkanoate granule multifunctional regulatory protein n=1 Tax=Lacisediminimonas profundi TaxID=2603856 RepID=UPI001884899D|nr:PhaM family polyhydroxyalkanoate granule multifunctional regulatory protein [Lacisediminimonas profundi]
MSTSNTEIPGMGPMPDPLGFMKDLWGGVKMPGMTMPSLSVDDINKQIADLKAVESWLALNMNMLRGTIQALEVQSATLTALQSMGQTMGQSMGSMEQAMGAAMSAAGSMAGMNPMGAMPAAAAAGAAPAEEAPVQPASPFSFTPPTAEKPPAPEPEPVAKEADPAGEGSGVDSVLAGAAAPFVNPAGWWSLLQDQFRQAVEKAMEPDAATGPARKRPAAKASGATKKPASGAKPATPAKSTTAVKNAKTAKSAKSAKTTAAARPARSAAVKAKAKGGSAGSRASASPAAGRKRG